LIGIIIQARMGSNRLPGKVLKKIGNKTLLEHIFYRLSFLKTSVKVILATSINPENDIIESFCSENNITCYRGSENNVLERYYLCAKKYNFEHIIRLTADNPFTDIEELDNLINLHLETKSDYSHSFTNLPKGVGAEIFTFKTLEKSCIEGKEPHHLEHVNEYILENLDLFKITVLNVPKEKNKPEISLTIDTLEDYKKACFLVNKSENEFINIKELVQLLMQYEKENN